MMSNKLVLKLNNNFVFKSNKCFFQNLYNEIILNLNTIVFKDNRYKSKLISNLDNKRLSKLRFKEVKYNTKQFSGVLKLLKDYFEDINDDKNLSTINNKIEWIYNIWKDMNLNKPKNRCVNDIRKGSLNCILKAEDIDIPNIKILLGDKYYLVCDIQDNENELLLILK